jgi:uncharacterized protein YebE (UPF0316 family)
MCFVINNRKHKLFSKIIKYIGSEEYNNFYIKNNIVHYMEGLFDYAYFKNILNTNNSIFIVIAYALGFSVGTYIGGKISKKFIKTNLEVQVILSSRSDNIVNFIKSEGYGVTVIEVNGSNNKKYMLYIQIKNKSFEHLKQIIKKFDPKAFIVVNEAKYVENGYFNVNK